MPALKLQIASVGKLKEKYWIEAQAEYLKRLKPFAQVNLIVVDDVDPFKAGGEEQARAKEAANLRKSLNSVQQQCHIFKIALDIKGQQFSSEQLAELISGLTVKNTSTIVFYIGGPTGLDRALLDSADLKLSFGSITLPHNLAQVVLLEQIYRAFKIIHNQPYHR